MFVTARLVVKHFRLGKLGQEAGPQKQKRGELKSLTEKQAGWENGMKCCFTACLGGGVGERAHVKVGFVE